MVAGGSYFRNNTDTLTHYTRLVNWYRDNKEISL